MRRTPDWQHKLHDFLVARAKEPFAWGSNDCALFAADAIQAITGEDLAAEFRGYKDEEGATAAVKSVANGTTVEDAVVYIAKKHNLQERKSILFAQRGDLVIYQGTEGLAAGVVHLSGTHALFVSPTGLHKIRLRYCKRAWKVGA